MSGILHLSTTPQTLTISGTPIITTTVNQAYSGFTVSARGGNRPYTFTIQSGTFPSGITINASTGVISGTPSIIALATGIIIRVTDYANHTADLASFNINVTV